MTRLGMAGSGCVRVQQSVDAMYIFSTAYLLQSRCGRVVILCYRGTEPTNVASWLGDADAGTERLSVGPATGDAGLAVHRGFYRNFRATHWQVLQELSLASNGRQLGNPNERVDYPLEALYVTGHSLGGAMAILFALTTASERLRGVYTFGQPMVVAGALSASAKVAGSKIVRHDAHPPHRYLDVLRPPGRLTEFGD